eukprot:TRINITY_DN1191_c0_g2_i3.p1 TRINITY_DN1191_c0_g2~~TRINITY_DN1191_c0_g2_i3.p1  ORF type:complete len:498 (+),score=131.33 TRINITY_DN1191_c0_g2_i3:91-1584(+)
MNDEKSAEDWKAEGNQFHTKQKYMDAIRCYSKAIEVDSTKAVYYANRSASYSALERWADASQDAKKAVELDSSYSKGHLRAGKAALALGKLAEAKSSFEKTKELEPSACGSELALLKILERDYAALKSNVDDMSFSEESLAQVNRLVGNCPASVEIQLLQAQVYISQGKLDEALGITTRIATRDRSNPHATYVRGLVLYNMGDSEKAVTHFQETLRMDPDFRKAQLLLKKVRQIEAKKKEGNQAFSSGQHKDAVDLYTQALEVDPSNKNLNAILYGNRAAAHMKVKDYTKALADCNSSLSLNPTYSKSISRRAQCYMALEQYEDAVRDFQNLANSDPENRDYAEDLRQAKLAQKRAGRKDLYKILEVSKDADQNEIKKAYRRLALQWHPDKHSSTEETHAIADKKFKEIGEAYAILSDEQKKQQYDQGAEVDDINQGTAGMRHGGMDPNQVFQMFFGGGGGGFPGGGFPGGGFHAGGFPGGGRHSRGGNGGFDFFFQ